MTPVFVCFVYLGYASNGARYLSSGYRRVPAGSDEPKLTNYYDDNDCNSQKNGENDNTPEQTAQEIEKESKSPFVEPPPPSPKLSPKPAKQDSDKTMEGWLILLIFVAVFILFILASIYVFRCREKDEKESTNICRLSSIKSFKSYRSPSMSVDFVSSFSSNQSSAYNAEYKIEETAKTTPSTSMIPRRWLRTKLLGKGRFGCVHLCIDLQHKLIAGDIADHCECNQAKATKKRIKNIYIWMDNLVCRRSKSLKKGETNVPNVKVDDIKYYAVKRARLEIGGNNQNGLSKECKSIYEEIGILTDLEHENIVKMYGSVICNDSILMFMECCPMGTLSQILKEFGPLDLITTHRFIKQLLCAIEYLHSLSVVHRDIKSRNILIASSHCIKLADFGCSVDVNTLKDTQRSSRIGGTVHWMPPEIFQKSYHSLPDLYKHDIWSLGVVAIEMLTCHPMHYQTKPKIFTNLLKNNIDKLRIPVMDNEHVNGFINKCLTVEVTERPTATELMANEAFILADDIFDCDEKAVAIKFEMVLGKKYKASIQGIENLIRSNQQYFA